MCDYDSNISAGARNKTEWIPRFRFGVKYDMMGDMEGTEWAHLVLTNAMSIGKIVNYEVFTSLQGYFGLKTVLFSIDVDIPHAEGFAGMLEVGTGIANEIVGDSDAEAIGVTLLNQKPEPVEEPLADWERELLMGPEEADAWNKEQAEKASDEASQDVYYNPAVKHLSYDKWTGRYFHSTLEEMELAAARVNEIVLQEGELMLNDFYDQLGLMPIRMGNDFGWNEPIRLIFGNITTQSGAPALTMSFRNEPKPCNNR